MVGWTWMWMWMRMVLVPRIGVQCGWRIGEVVFAIAWGLTGLGGRLSMSQRQKKKRGVNYRSCRRCRVVEKEIQMAQSPVAGRRA